MTRKITIRKGFDAHVHLRHGEMMRNVLPYTARQFAGGVAMGNLPGDAVIDTIEKRSSYLRQAAAIAPNFKAIVPLMITKGSLEDKEIVFKARDAGVKVFKFIPGGLTNNGADGLTLYDFYSDPFISFLTFMEHYGIILSCHFEVGTDRLNNDAPIDPLNQEKEAIRFLRYLLESFPRLKIIVEHASSAEMINFVERLPEQYKVAATLTAHHALLTYPEVFGINGELISNLYCKPVAKYKDDLIAVKLAMCSGNSRFFAGTDSAPHLLEAKVRRENPAPGIFSAPIALQTYAQIFDSLDRIEYLENFTSVFGPQFYGIKPSDQTITLIKELWIIPEMLHGIPVLMGGQKSFWDIEQ